MNAARRKALGEAIDLIAKFKNDFEDAKALVESAASEERDYYDNMPPGVQSGDKGQTADEAATNLEAVQSALEDCDLDDLISKIDEARGVA